MLGSGEKTVAPTIVLPSRSFCFAVLKIRSGCCICASPSAIEHKSAAQDMAIEIVAHEEYRFAIGFLLGHFFRRKRSRPGRMILLRVLAGVSPPGNSTRKCINSPSLRSGQGA